MVTRAPIPHYSDLPPDVDKAKLAKYSDLPPDTDHAALDEYVDPSGTPAEDWHGVKEFGRDLWGAVKGVGSLLDPRIPTSQDDERTGESHAIDRGIGKFAPLLLPGYRAVKGMVTGTQDSIERSRQSMEEGDTAGAVFHTAAAALPVVGQLTEGVYDKANSGDTSGAVGAGLSRALQISTLGSDEPGVVGRTTSAPVRAAGRLTATGAGLSKDAVVGGYRGFTREPGMVARPTNAVIEAATEMGKRLKPTPMLERMTKTPVGEKFAPTDVKADAQSGDHPIDMSAGEISGHPTLQRIQQVGERSLTGGEPVRERIEGAQRAIAERVNDLKEGYAAGDKVPDTETAGLTVQKQAQTAMQKLKTSAQAKFDKWIAKAGDVPVDTTAINAKYADKYADMNEALRNLPPKYAQPIQVLLKKAEGMGVPDVSPEEAARQDMVEQVRGQVHPDRLDEVLRAQSLDKPLDTAQPRIKMSTAQKLRSAYSDIANNFSGNVPSDVQRIAGELYHDIDSAMENSAKTYSQSTGKRGVMRGYRDANAEWSQMQALYNSPGEPLYRTLKATDGQKVVNQLLEPGTSGGSPKNIRVLRDQGVDLGPLQREVLERIHNKNFGVYGKSKLGGYSDAFLRELFGPVGMEELHMLGKQARAINYNVNPSGTAGVMSATHDLTDVAKAGGQVAKGNFPWYLENPFIKYGAAKLANNPAFNDWMTNTKGAAVEPGGREFRLGKGPGAMLAPDSNLKMKAGPNKGGVTDPERMLPPEGGTHELMNDDDIDNDVRNRFDLGRTELPFEYTVHENAANVVEQHNENLSRAIQKGGTHAADLVKKGKLPLTRRALITDPSEFYLHSPGTMSAYDVMDYTGRLRAGEEPPPIMAARTDFGKYIIDGQHRASASQRSGIPIEADLIDLRSKKFQRSRKANANSDVEPLDEPRNKNVKKLRSRKPN